MTEELKRDERWENVEASIEPSLAGEGYVEVRILVPVFSELTQRPVRVTNVFRARHNEIREALDYVVDRVDKALDEGHAAPLTNYKGSL